MTPKNKVWIGLGILILIITPVFAYLALEYVNVKGDYEWSNNATLFAEVGIGIVVALFILMLTKMNEFRMDAKISSVLDIVQERERIQIEKSKQAYSSVRSSLQEIQSRIVTIQSASKSFDNSEDDTSKNFYHVQIVSLSSEIKKFSEDIFDNSNKFSLEFIDIHTINMIKIVSSICKHKPVFSKNDTTVDMSSYDTLKVTIDNEIGKLNEKIRDEPNSQQTTLQANIEKTSMSVSSDRTIYPLNSTVYMCANLASAIEGEKIVFQIFNSERRLLLSKIFDPENPDYPELAKVNLFETCFKMEGEEWKIGKQYIVRATHGSSYAEDSFTIDRRTPVIQSDKSVYTIGSDMIITVIDPDADMDSDIVEFIGDRDDSRLVIESKYGKIDGYRLRETGNSTGIFQGVIGFLGIKKNGTVFPQEFGGQVIDKIQGTGIEDGYIGARNGDEITITYTNSANVVCLSVFIANFDSVVSMDRERYSSTDKVYLTIVSPDFNSNSEKVDEIGQKPENTIQIRTSVDRLDNYKLVETGKDTGIFVGELQLVLINKKSSKPLELKGPNDGVLYCSKEDFIEVVFTPFEDDSVVQKAIIHS